MRLRRLVVVLTFVVCGFARAAVACPVCDSETGGRVRAGIFDEHFARNLLAVVLPFPVVAAVAAAIHFGLPSGLRLGLSRRSETHDDGD